MRMTEAKKTKGVKTETMLAARFKFKKPKDEIDEAIQAFLKGETEGRFGRYWIHGAMLVYKTAITEQMSVLGHRYGVDDKANRLQVLENVKGLISRAETLQIDLVSHSVEELKATAKALEERSDERFKTNVKYRTVKANLIAKRIDALTYVGNSSALSLIGRSVSFGNESLNRDETDVQRRLSMLIPMIPFTVFNEAGLDLDQYRLIDRGTEETVTRLVQGKFNSKTGDYEMKAEAVHFTGASLFEVDGHWYLFDIDRREIQEQVFNPFLAEIPHAVSTIAEAYDALKPADVKAAESEGLKVLRQGEWFFIPVVGNHEADLNPRFREHTEEDAVYNPRRMRGELRAGANRPNHVSLFNEAKSLFSGVVTHSGREHAPLQLKGWYRAVPNTATRSFTITGDID